MDCLELRRQLGTDPRLPDPAARAHLEACPGCRDAHSRAQAFDARIAQALAVGVPEGFADRVLLAQLTAERQKPAGRGFRYGWVALAAAAALVVAIGLARRESVGTSMPDLAVAHVNGGEKPALDLRTPVPSADVAKAFADRGVTLASVPPDVSYVQKCPVGGYKSVHMVMPRDNEGVGVLYIVKYRAPGVTNFERGGVHGREVPIADGTLVMVAPNTAPFDSLEHAWRDALQGPAQTAAGSR
ncbi:MAG TPA: DUF3379 family protein [Rhodanobacteraceae bacterium]|nr:DUF3379 family protein [Rhodanobacteraceae bacterium]